MRCFLRVLAGTAWLALTGCHSHYVEATIRNSSDAAVSVVQVDYPHASFGTQLLPPGAAFHYRFKLLGSGPVKLTYIDAHHGDHTQTGPSLNEGQEGQLDITLSANDQVAFHTSLKP